MQDGAYTLYGGFDVVRLGNVAFSDLDARFAFQAREVAHRQVEDAHRVAVGAAAGHQAAADAAGAAGDEDRTAHVIVVPSILALVTSVLVAFCSFSRAPGRLSHF